MCDAFVKIFINICLCEDDDYVVYFLHGTHSASL